ncbi:hypothetical protein ACQ4PT_043096 [Festuca glaucescens]
MLLRPTSLTTAAAVYAARCALNTSPRWRDVLEHHTGLAEWSCWSARGGWQACTRRHQGASRRWSTPGSPITGLAPCRVMCTVIIVNCVYTWHLKCYMITKATSFVSDYVSYYIICK